MSEEQIGIEKYLEPDNWGLVRAEIRREVRIAINKLNELAKRYLENPKDFKHDKYDVIDHDKLRITAKFKCLKNDNYILLTLRYSPSTTGDGDYGGYIGYNYPDNDYMVYNCIDYDNALAIEHIAADILDGVWSEEKMSGGHSKYINDPLNRLVFYGVMQHKVQGEYKGWCARYEYPFPPFEYIWISSQNGTHHLKKPSSIRSTFKHDWYNLIDCVNEIVFYKEGGIPSKQYTFPDNESVYLINVMDFINDCHKYTVKDELMPLDEFHKWVKERRRY